MAAAIDSSNKTNDKLSALKDFFMHAGDADKVWGIALLTGRRPRRVVTPTQLAMWATQLADIEGWLFDVCYQVTGDLSETIALVTPDSEESTTKSLAGWMDYLSRLNELDVAARFDHIASAWRKLDSFEKFIFNKLISGNFRLGVSTQLVIRALAEISGQEVSAIAYKLSGNWSPWNTTFDELIYTDTRDISHPYPFYLAYQLDQPVTGLGKPDNWQAEWKWDGIRGQIVKRASVIFIWTRGGDLATERFPELKVLENVLPDGTVLDGEIIPCLGDQVLPFSKLQTRLGRKKLTPKILREVPVCFYAYDILEHDGVDIRHLPLVERRVLLEVLAEDVSSPALVVSPVIEFDVWDRLTSLRSRSRSYKTEGVMLKRVDSAYGTGRKKGAWWKWKIDPLSVDAVLIYAQKGSGRRAGLFTDYTFAVWNDRMELVPFAKAYSGLTNEEILKVNRYVRSNTIEKFGPVHSVKPELVFEIGFEGISKSARHKSGIAVRFPRILRWRHDKTAAEADSLDGLYQLLEQYSA